MTAPNTDPGHPEVQAYFAEAASPSVIGTSEAGQQLVATLDTVGRVLEQCGKSRRLLNLARMADPQLYSALDGVNKPLTDVARDCEEIQRLLNQLAKQIEAIDAANLAAKDGATNLGYVFPT